MSYYQNAHQARSKSHIRSENAMDMASDHNKRKHAQRSKQDHTKRQMRDDTQNTEQDLVLKPQKYSSKSKSQEKSAGRRSARPKGSNSKKQSISDKIPPEKRNVSQNATGKYEGLNHLRDGSNGRDVIASTPNQHKP